MPHIATVTESRPSSTPIGMSARGPIAGERGPSASRVSTITVAITSRHDTSATSLIPGPVKSWALYESA